jgi:hypothetical protein
MPEKAVTDSDISDTPGYIFNIYESEIHINNNPESVIAKNGLKNFHDSTSGEKSENITVIACCNASSCYNIQRRQQETRVGWWLTPPGSNVCMKRKSSPCISKPSSLQLFCIHLNKVQTLNIGTLKFQLF